MQTLNDLKDKLDEIDAERQKIVIAKKAVEKAEDRYYDVSYKLFAKACEIINNIVERACCQRILDIKWVSSEKIHVIYEYCCRGNEGVDRAEFPPKYFFMDEDDYIADVLKMLYNDCCASRCIARLYLYRVDIRTNVYFEYMSLPKLGIMQPRG